MKAQSAGKAAREEKKIRVLYADDTPLDVDLIHAALDRAPGFELCACTTPAEMDARLAQGGWDIVVTELGVFGWGTFGLLDRIRESHPTIPVAIVAGSGPDDVAAEAIRHGAVEFIRKSDVDPRDLPRLLRHLIDKHRLAWGNLLLERDHRRIEGRMMATEERLRILDMAAESAANGIVITDCAGGILWTNAAFVRQTGYTREETAGKTPRILKSGRQNRAVYDALWKTILGGNAWQGELVNRRKDGSLFTEEMTITPLRGAGGTITHFIGISVDVSEERRLRGQLAQAVKMESIGQLAGGIAHDFNNLLQAILGYAELLRSGLKDEDPRAADVDQIRTAARQAADLTRQLLAFSRRQLIKTEPLDLNAVVKGTARLLQRVIGEHIRLDLQLADDLHPILADPGQVESIIMNLAANARDAMPDGGRLTLATRTVTFQELDLSCFADARSGRFACLSVTDTGVGMDADVLSHIFEPFYTTKAIGKGTGLGLSTVHGVVHQHGGWVHVYSEKDQGTCFKIYLPTIDQAPQPPAETGPEPRSASEKHILIVEDEDSICQLAARVLREGGYRVTMAHSANEARIAFQARGGEIDLLFCDVVLPDQNGVMLVESLLQMRPGMRVLMVSGYPDDFARWETIRERGYPFLQKPYPARDLVRIVRGVLETGATPKA